MIAPSRLISAAVKRGLTEQSVITLVAPAGSHNVSVIVSYVEPEGIEVPLDVMWLHPDGTFLRRTSRSASETHENTWEVLDVGTFYDPQSWDLPKPDDNTVRELTQMIGNYHLVTLDELGGVSRSGDTVTGPLNVRVLDSEEDYGSEETLPRSVLDAWIGRASNLAYSVYGQLKSVRNALAFVRDRVTIIEAKLEGLESGNIQSYLHEQNLPSNSWVIEHNLGTYVMTQVFTSSGELVLPKDIIRMDNTKLIITFASNVSGNAQIFRVG